MINLISEKTNDALNLAPLLQQLLLDESVTFFRVLCKDEMNRKIVLRLDLRQSSLPPLTPTHNPPSLKKNVGHIEYL